MKRGSFGFETNEIRKFVFLSAFIASIAVASVAQAAPNLVLEFLAGPDNSTENTGVRARLTFSFFDEPGDDLVSVEITNTTPPEIGSSLTSIGLEWPFVIADPVFAPGGMGVYFDHLDYDVNVHPDWINGADGYDAVLTGDGSFEGGMPLGAPLEGESDVVVWSVGNTGLSADELFEVFHDFYSTSPPPLAVARFQAIGGENDFSDKVIVTTYLPEPSCLLLLGLGGLLANKRRFLKHLA